jgi:hypothetical protein
MLAIYLGRFKMDYKNEYDNARKIVVEYLEIEDEELIKDHDNLPLKDLMDILVDKYNHVILDSSMMQIAYQSGLKYELLDRFFSESEQLFDSLEEGEELSEESLVELIGTIKEEV